MKTMKRKALILGMMISAMSLVACGNSDSQPAGGSNSGASTKVTSEKPADTIPEEVYEDGPVFEDEDNSAWPSYTVTFDYEGAGTNSSQEVKYKGKLTKPADPTAPVGKKFYGWMNKEDGGRIWNFNRKMLNAVMGDMTLVPCYVDADKEAQTFEAEYCPDILGEDGTGMDGATYSGGQKGLGLIATDDDNELGASHKLGVTDEYGDYVKGGFVHFLYVTGDTLTWKLNSSAAAENVTLFMRLGAEYATFEEEFGKGRRYGFTDEMFTVKVNDEALKYGTIVLRNVPEVGHFLPFADFMVSATVSLKAGENVIQMKVDNNVTIFSTAAATAPMVDCIKLYSSSTLTWPEECLENVE